LFDFHSLFLFSVQLPSSTAAAAAAMNTLVFYNVGFAFFGDDL